MQKPNEEEVYVEFRNIEKVINEYSKTHGDKEDNNSLDSQQLMTLFVGLLANAYARIKKLEDAAGFNCEHLWGTFKDDPRSGNPDGPEHIACTKCGRPPKATNDA